MRIIKKIVDKIARKLLYKQLKKQIKQVEFHNMQSAKHIGILFDTTKQENINIVAKFYSDLKNQTYNVSAAGWYKGNEVPKEPINALNFIYFSALDHNWRGVPQTQKILEFFKQKFDILFVLTQTNDLAIQYITSLSPAVFKIGAKGNNAEYLNFMIELKENASIKDLIQDSITYLSEIKKN